MSASIKALLLMICAIYSGTAPAAAPATKPLKGTIQTIVRQFSSHQQPALQTILRLGETARVPMGVILADNSLCAVKVKIRSSHETVAAILSAILHSQSGYRWIVRDGVVIIMPKVMPAPSAKFLQLRIPRFSAPRGSFQDLGAYLYMDVKAVLRPSEGSAFDILSSASAAQAGPFEVQNHTVMELIIMLARQANGAAWVLLPVPKDHSAVADYQLIQLIGYPDVDRRIEQMSCSP